MFQAWCDIKLNSEHFSGHDTGPAISEPLFQNFGSFQCQFCTANVVICVLLAKSEVLKLKKIFWGMCSQNLTILPVYTKCPLIEPVLKSFVLVSLKSPTKTK